MKAYVSLFHKYLDTNIIATFFFFFVHYIIIKVILDLKYIKKIKV